MNAATILFSISLKRSNDRVRTESEWEGRGGEQERGGGGKKDTEENRQTPAPCENGVREELVTGNETLFVA